MQVPKRVPLTALYRIEYIPVVPLGRARRISYLIRACHVLLIYCSLYFVAMEQFYVNNPELAAYEYSTECIRNPCMDTSVTGKITFPP